MHTDVEIDTVSEQAIVFAYRHALKREPTHSELVSWSVALAGGIPFEHLVLEIITGEDATALAKPRDTSSIEGAIAFIYRYALRRMPLPSEITQWTLHLQRGLTFEDFLSEVRTSEEAKLLPRYEDESPSEDAIAFVYRHALRRDPSPDDLETWFRHFRSGLPFQRFVLDVMKSEEASKQSSAQEALADLTDGLYIAHLYEKCLGRCALPTEVFDWKQRLAREDFSRRDLLTSFFGTAVRDEQERAEAALRHDPAAVTIMGTDITLSAAVWRDRAIELKGANQRLTTTMPQPKPYVVKSRGVRVSAIASLYKGGPYIDKFLANICNQSLGSDFELIIIDANSPDDEYETIRKYQKRFNNIRYERVNYRIGIYDAWNYGVDLSQGEYLTNTNVDDLRRTDSFEIQANQLDELDFVDVVYQDFFYSFDPCLGFDEVAAFGFKSDLPLVSPNNILRFNSPHNAPMWRKRLHSEIGMFDTTLKSAGDHDMWCRCLLAGKVFFKINTPHVVYYQNPQGISTRPGTRGVDEGMGILRKYGRRLISPYVYMDAEPFSEVLRKETDLASLKTDPLDFRAITQAHLIHLMGKKQQESRMDPLQ